MTKHPEGCFYFDIINAIATISINIPIVAIVVAIVFTIFTSLAKALGRL